MTSTFTQNKKCEICLNPVPDDFQNLLCWSCYEKMTAENEQRKKEEAEELAKRQAAENLPKEQTTPAGAGDDLARPLASSTAEAPAEAVKSPCHGEGFSRCGILNPAYQENPEADDKDQVLANVAQFIYSHDPKKKRKGKLLWYPTRNIYNFIRDYARKSVMKHPQYPKQIWKPYIVDVGCGIGAGSNVMSQEAHFAWGIDKNEFSIEFAQEAFTRERNNIYYSGQVTFDVFDVMVDTREVAQFDYIVAIEIVEHVEDVDKFIRSLFRFARHDRRGNYQVSPPSEFFISTPNRNNPKIRKDRPENPYHVREWTAQEFTQLMKKYFQTVELLDQRGSPVSEDTLEQPILARCSLPI